MVTNAIASSSSRLLETSHKSTATTAIMSAKELTFKEVAEHNTKKDLYMVIHDKVYDCSSFVDEHPYVSRIFQLFDCHRIGHAMD